MSDEDNSLDDAINGIGDEDNSKIVLEELINDYIDSLKTKKKYVGSLEPEKEVLHDFRVAKGGYNELKSQAEARAVELGWEVVVVDFNDPNNLYTKEFVDREKELKHYEGKNVIFFHGNVDKACDETDFYAASFHARCRRPGQEGHIFISCLDGFEVNTKSKAYYDALWGGNYKSRSQINCLTEELTNVIEIALNSEGTYYINLVGEGSAKSETIRSLSNNFEGPSHDFIYLSMDYYEGMGDEKKIFDDITIINPAEVLILDGGEYVTRQLHEMLTERYKIIVYASPEPLEHEGIDRLVEL